MNKDFKTKYDIAVFFILQNELDHVVHSIVHGVVG